MERRQWPRAALRAKVTVLAPGVARTISSGAYLRNISKHGFAFATEDAVVKGGLYQFNIQTYDMVLDLTARVMHLRHETTYYVVGARVENLSLTQRSRLNRALSPLFKGWHRHYVIYSLGCGAAVFLLLKYGFLFGWGSSGGIAAMVTIVVYALFPF